MFYPTTGAGAQQRQPYCGCITQPVRPGLTAVGGKHQADARRRVERVFGGQRFAAADAHGMAFAHKMAGVHFLLRPLRAGGGNRFFHVRFERGGFDQLETVGFQQLLPLFFADILRHDINRIAALVGSFAAGGQRPFTQRGFGREGRAHEALQIGGADAGKFIIAFGGQQIEFVAGKQRGLHRLAAAVNVVKAGAGAEHESQRQPQSQAGNTHNPVLLLPERIRFKRKVLSAWAAADAA